MPVWTSSKMSQIPVDRKAHAILQRRFVWDIDAAFTLDRFDKNTNSLLRIDGIFGGSKIVVRNLPEPCRQRIVTGPNFLLASRR